MSAQAMLLSSAASLGRSSKSKSRPGSLPLNSHVRISTFDFAPLPLVGGVPSAAAAGPSSRIGSSGRFLPGLFSETVMSTRGLADASQRYRLLCQLSYIWRALWEEARGWQRPFEFETGRLGELARLGCSAVNPRVETALDALHR